MSSQSGCTVQNGPLTHEVESGKQFVFQALADFIQIEGDEAALLLGANFKLAPARAWLLGLTGRGVDALPRGYFAEFLESTGTQYIDTGYVPDAESGMRFDGNSTIPGDFIPMGCRNAGNTDTRYYIMRKGYSVSTGFGWGKWSGTLYEAAGNPGRWVGTLNWLNSRRATISPPVRAYALPTLSFIPTREVFIYASNIGGAPSLLWSGRVYAAGISKGSEVVRDYVPFLDKNGTPCMFDKVTRKPFYNNGTGQFIVGMTLEQARKLSKLPKPGGTLTVSLPWEAGVDATVQDALATAAENGWTVVVQYREPEAATENIAVDFLETTGTQIIVDENISVDENSSWKLKTVKTSNKSITSVLDATAGGNNRFSIIAYNGVWRFDYAALMQRTKSIALGQIYELELTEDLRCLVNGEEVHKFERTDFWSGSRFTLFDFKEKTAGYVGRIFYVDVLGANTQRAFVPTIDKNGVPCMHDSVSGQNFYNSGSGAFIAGFESTEKAALGLARLPVVEAGELTVSLPAAAQEESTRVPAAIEVARQRGWTIVAQYRED